jgi:spermidine/putrescine transport system substrate-binding protein
MMASTPILRTGFALLIVLALELAQPAAGHAGQLQLRFFTWADYIAPEVIAKFQREQATTITITPIHSDQEILTGLLAKSTGFDLASPVDFQVPLLIRAGALEKIDGSALGNFFNVEPAWRGLPYDKHNDYSVPFMWGTTSFVVDTALYQGDIDTYTVLFNPPAALKGRISLLVGSAEPIRMGWAYLGLPSCSTDKAQIQRALDLFRPLINPALVSTISTVIPILAGDQAAAGLAWNGDAMRARLKKPSLRYAYPREGTFIWSDTLVVPKDAPNRAAAIAFINFMQSPENAALQSNFTRYANTVRNSDAFMTQDILDAPEVIMPTDVKINFRQFCDGDTVASYVEAWDRMLNYPK